MTTSLVHFKIFQDNSVPASPVENWSRAAGGGVDPADTAAEKSDDGGRRIEYSLASCSDFSGIFGPFFYG